eukprot:3155612-Amphidinium_carterae.1
MFHQRNSNSEQVLSAYSWHEPSYSLAYRQSSLTGGFLALRWPAVLNQRAFDRAPCPTKHTNTRNNRIPCVKRPYHKAEQGHHQAISGHGSGQLSSGTTLEAVG